MLLKFIENDHLLFLQGIYVTHVYENGPAHHAGLQVHDKILQVRGFSFCTNEQNIL